MTSKKGKLFAAIALLFIAAGLSACPMGDRVYFVPRDFKGQDIAVYLKEHYPLGTDENILIRDFTAEGYHYIPPKEIDQKRRLIYPYPCPPKFYAMAEQRYIAWQADQSGSISSIEEIKISSCGMIYP